MMRGRTNVIWTTAGTISLRSCSSLRRRTVTMSRVRLTFSPAIFSFSLLNTRLHASDRSGSVALLLREALLSGQRLLAGVLLELGEDLKYDPQKAPSCGVLTDL